MKFSIRKKGSLKAHSGPLYAMSKGRTAGDLFTAGADKVVAEWNLELQGVSPMAIRTDSTVYSLLRTNENELVIGTGVGGMHVINLQSRLETRHLKFHDRGIFHMAFHPGLKHVYASSADGSLSIWDAVQWSLLFHLKLTQKKVRKIVLNHSGNVLAVACGDGSIKIIDVPGYRLLYDIEAHQDSANAVAFLPNGDLLSGGKDAYLRIWSAAKHFTLLKSVPAHNFAVYDLVVNADEGWIASASRDKSIKIWDLDLAEKPTRIDRKTLEGHTHSVNGLWYDATTKTLASCSDDRSVMLWSIEKRGNHGLDTPGDD